MNAAYVCKIRQCLSWCNFAPMVFQQDEAIREAKSSTPGNGLCRPDTADLLKRYPMTATSFQLIGKETERGWEQNDDVSTLMPSLVRYGSDTGIADEHLRKRLLEIPLALLEFETGMSRHAIVRARRGQSIHARSLRLLKDVVRRVPARDGLLERAWAAQRSGPKPNDGLAQIRQHDRIDREASPGQRQVLSVARPRMPPDQS